MGIEKQHNSCRSITVFVAWVLLTTFFMSGEGKIENIVDPKNRVILSLQAAIEEVQKVQALAVELPDSVTGTHESRARQDCLKLFEDTIYRLNSSLNVMKTSHLEQRSAMADVHTWVSAALTNQHMCIGGLSGTIYNREIKNSIILSEVGSSISLHVSKLKNLIGDSLGLFVNLIASVPPVAGKNRVLLRGRKMGFPEWVSGEKRRRLFQFSPDVVVAQDGSGNFTTITEALYSYVLPQGEKTHFVVYVKAGEYHEKVVIEGFMMNLMLIGDGMNKTVVVGDRCSSVWHSLYASSTFVVWANGFVAKDITIANTAGPKEFQAVALLIAGDMAVIYRCSIEGYQDTLLLHTNRQFFRRCHIYGTIDFIFGDSMTVIQKSSIFVRRPLDGQVNTITAQGRTNSSQSSAIIIHACNILAAPDFVPMQKQFKTYLGRPWHQFSRTVIMQSSLDQLIDPAGWLQWDNMVSDLSTVFYGEFMNVGAGANTSRRVNWPGYHVISDPAEAEKFSVGKFISGNSWIPISGVPYNSSLNAF
ncbi:hypothetical protein SUGI_1015220 [Cryptomeria japonica]|uniref:pectinesterase-like n=1 Tax=Cryptomeria japonica TaxID=3369 RepID=UPI00241480E7|nr:pectinesterase-like [Cryptomeria japonica]GLJ48084.1 hypothetical protein SUGI_1015220 [Cryptomeria japonica]